MLNLYQHPFTICPDGADFESSQPQTEFRIQTSEDKARGTLKQVQGDEVAVITLRVSVKLYFQSIFSKLMGNIVDGIEQRQALHILLNDQMPRRLIEPLLVKNSRDDQMR